MKTKLIFTDCKARYLALLTVLTLLFTIGVGNAWGAYTLVYTLDCATASSDGSESTYGVNRTTVMTGSGVKAFINAAAGTTLVSADATVSGSVYWAKGQGGAGIPDDVLKVGKASGPGSISFTIGGSDNITKVVVTGYGWKNTSTISVNSATEQTPTTAATETDFTFENLTATKTITISVTTSAVCITSIKLYKTAAASTYTVTYQGNGNTGGTVPTDATSYSSGSTVTVKGNTGSLVKTGWSFGGWNTNATGTGSNYAAGTGTFSISANTTLYAKWTCTVTWSVNKATNVYPATTVTYNPTSSKVGSLPSPNPDPGSYCGDKFMGWTSDENYVHGTSNLFTTAAGSPNLNSIGSTTFYAVFADKVTPAP